MHHIRISLIIIWNLQTTYHTVFEAAFTIKNNNQTSRRQSICAFKDWIHLPTRWEYPTLWREVYVQDTPTYWWRMGSPMLGRTAPVKSVRPLCWRWKTLVLKPKVWLLTDSRCEPKLITHSFILRNKILLRKQKGWLWCVKSIYRLQNLNNPTNIWIVKIWCPGWIQRGLAGKTTQKTTNTVIRIDLNIRFETPTPKDITTIVANENIRTIQTSVCSPGFVSITNPAHATSIRLHSSSRRWV